MFEEPEFNDLDFDLQLKRFEEMLAENSNVYFDVEVFEDIIDYYIENSEYKKALRGLDIALSQHPFATGLMLLKADLYVSTGKLNKGLEVLNNIEQFEPYNPEVFILKASVYSQQRNFDDAIRNLKSAIKYADKEDLDDLYIDLAVEYENCEKYDKAVSCLKKALELNPENETALYEISYCYEIADKNDEAIAFYQAYIDEHPYSYLAWHHLGTAWIKAGLNEKAVEAFDFCIAIKNDFSTAYFNKATVLMMDEKYHEAMDNLMETILRDEAIGLTYLYLGECFEKTGDLLSAEQNYLKAIELEDEMPEAYISLALLKNQQNQYVEAEYYCKQAIALDGENPDYWYLMAEILENAGNIEGANEAYIKTLALNKENADILLDYSNFKLINFGTEEAIETLETCDPALANHPLLLYRLAVYYYAKGLKQQSYLFFEKALSLDYKSHTSAFDYFPELAADINIMNLVQSHQ